MMKTIPLAVISVSLFALTGCVSVPKEPIVSSFNGDSVTIITPMNSQHSAIEMAKAEAEAARICYKGDSGSKAEYVSTRSITRIDPFFGPISDQEEHLFLCLK